jgi:hypothetical protein
VEHACYQCGKEVEDGRPFCPHCRAPQIHVPAAVAETAASDLATENSAAARENADLFPPNSYDSRGTVFSPNPLASRRIGPADINARFAVGAALKAGLLGILLGMIPLLGILLTGGLAVYFYQRASKTVPSALASARLGGAAGIVVFAANALATLPVILFHAQQQCIDAITEMLHRSGFNGDTSQLQANLHTLLTPEGLAAIFVASSVLASVGGALASFLLRR